MNNDANLSDKNEGVESIRETEDKEPYDIAHSKSKHLPLLHFRQLAKQWSKQDKKPWSQEPDSNIVEAFHID